MNENKTGASFSFLTPPEQQAQQPVQGQTPSAMQTYVEQQPAQAPIQVPIQVPVQQQVPIQQPIQAPIQQQVSVQQQVPQQYQQPVQQYPQQQGQQPVQQYQQQQGQQPVVQYQQPMQQPQPQYQSPLPPVNVTPSHSTHSPQMQSQIQNMLSDPSKRDAELTRLFDAVSLSYEERILIFDKINNHQKLALVIEKLKPYIRY
jgi:hypothetical protein